MYHTYVPSDARYLSRRKLAGKFENSVDESDDVDTDWQDLMLRDGYVNSHDVSVSGEMCIRDSQYTGICSYRSKGDGNRMGYECIAHGTDGSQYFGYGVL